VLRQKLCDSYGVQPSDRDEATIVRIWRTHPNLVEQDGAVVARDYHAGNVRSPWAILAHRVKHDAERADAAHLIQAVAVDDPKAVRETRIRIRNAIYLHEELDVATDEITASLGPHAAPDLVAEMLELWRDRRLQVGWG
jgi:hypothetical protein